MTENEAKAIRWIRDINAEIIIKAISELDKYRAIGTVERFQQLAEQFKPHVTDKTSCPERHCNKCDKYRKENEKYHEIGTAGEYREARERHNKAYSHQLAYYDHNGHRYNGQVRFTEGIGNHDGQGNPITLQ